MPGIQFRDLLFFADTSRPTASAWKPIELAVAGFGCKISQVGTCDLSQNVAVAGGVVFSCLGPLHVSCSALLHSNLLASQHVQLSPGMHHGSTYPWTCLY